MKRSEMIQNIYDYMIGEYEENAVVYGFSENILKIIEEAGMLPPDEIEHDDDCPTYDGDECHGCVPRTLTRWEPEDET